MRTHRTWEPEHREMMVKAGPPVRIMPMMIHPLGDASSPTKSVLPTL